MRLKMSRKGTNADFVRYFTLVFCSLHNDTCDNDRPVQWPGQSRAGIPTPDGGWDRRVLRNEYIIFYDSGLNLALMCDPKKRVHTFVYKLQVLGNRAQIRA